MIEPGCRLRGELSEQIRRGIRLWLKTKGARVEAPRPRARTRGRS